MTDIDLVLSGGSVQGLCVQAGFIQALEPEVDVQRIAACSAGAIVAALWRTGRSADEVWRLVRDIDFSNYISMSLWGKIQFAYRGYISDGRAYRALLGELFGDQLSIGTDIELKIAVSNTTDGELESWGWDRPGIPLADAVYASSCIPGAFKPLDMGRAVYEDGGVYAHFPVQLLQQHAARPLIGSRFDNLQVAEKDLSGLDKLWLTLDRLTDANADASQHLAEMDCLVQPAMVFTTHGMAPGSDRFDLNAGQREALRARGYNAGLRAVEMLH